MDLLPLANLKVLESWLSRLSAALAIAALLRLFWQDLARIYRWLAAYLIADVLQAPIMWPIPIRSRTYGLVYMGTELIKTAFYVLLALEIYAIVLARYPGISRLGRRAMQVSLFVAVGLTLLTLQLDFQQVPALNQVLYYFRMAQRSVILTLAVFLLLVFAFLAWFPVRLSRNAALLTAGAVVMFTAKSSVLLMINLLKGDNIRLLSTANILIYCGCLAAWAIGLKRSGEAVETVFVNRGPAADALISRLDSINQSLVRMRDKPPRD